MNGFVIAALICNGAICQLVPAEPGVSYPTGDACRSSLDTKAAPLSNTIRQTRPNATGFNLICLEQAVAIVEVEQPYDVLDTTIVHAEPNAAARFVGTLEQGQRALVTGLMPDSQWLRVLLSDGKTGFVFGDRLRKVGRGQADAGAAPPAAPAPTAMATPAAPPPPLSAEFRDCPTCPVMVRLPSGSFAMGSNADASEKPVHSVKVAAFAMGKYEVTRAEWDACVAGGGCTFKPTQVEPTPDRRPVINLSWDDAGQYVQWLAKTTGKPYRLPSEAEWEYAARAGTMTRYPWGDEVGTGKASCNGCGGPREPLRAPEIGRFSPNAWGLNDTQGGAAEWVADCWHPTYQGAPADGSVWGGDRCERHVIRGGSWNNPPSDITVSSRNFYDTSVRYLTNGVRVAMTLR